MSSNLEILAAFLIRRARAEVGPPPASFLEPEGTVASEPGPLMPEPSAPPKEAAFVSVPPAEPPTPSAPPALPTDIRDASDPLTDRDPHEHEDDDYPRDEWGEIMYGACGYPCDGSCWQCVRVADYYDNMSRDRFDLADEI